MAGGWTGSSRLSSTETMVEGSFSWTAAGKLPVASSGLGGVLVNNKVLLTGMVNLVMQQLSVIIIILISQEGLTTKMEGMSTKIMY